MVSFFLILVVARFCLPHLVHAAPKNRAKIVEEYVVSAKFDENGYFPQLSDRGQPRETEMRKGGSVPRSPYSPPRNSHGGGGLSSDDSEGEDALEERDFSVYHHHLPPAPHPPPPPPPVGLAYAPSMYAVGLITFLILLNSLQTSLLIMKSKGSLLGSVTGALGRRKRSAVENVGGLLEKFEENNKFNGRPSPR